MLRLRLRFDDGDWIRLLFLLLLLLFVNYLC
jgi:hypothetical protein